MFQENQHDPAVSFCIFPINTVIWNLQHPQLLHVVISFSLKCKKKKKSKVKISNQPKNCQDLSGSETMCVLLNMVNIMMVTM